jgi:hypothetical protein
MDITNRIIKDIAAKNRLKKMDIVLDVPLHLIKVKEDEEGTLYIIEKVGNHVFFKR